MEHYLLELLRQTTDFIEENLLEPLNLTSISENVNVSKFHLLRIWKGATSTGLMEYVRRRRIAASLSDLLHHQNTIDFIASKYSFGSERAYTRIFKDEFGMTPAKWRKAPRPLEILDRFNADFMSQAGEGLIFLRSITIHPGLSLAGFQYEVDIEENRQNQIANQYGIDFFYQHRKRVLNPIEKDTYIGLTTFPEIPQSYTYYQPSIQIGDLSIVPPDMQIQKIQPHKYGVFTYIGPHGPEQITSKNLAKLWCYIHESWFPTIQFNLKQPFHFEYINYARCSKQYCECDLYFPISYL